MVLLFLALFCQKVHHNAHSDGKRRVVKREIAFLVVCLLVGLFWGLSLSSAGVLTEAFLSYIPVCFQTVFNRSPISPSFYLACVLFFSVLFFSVNHRLACSKGKKLSRTYSVQFFWKRYESEMKINDPELTTVGSCL